MHERMSAVGRFTVTAGLVATLAFGSAPSASADTHYPIVDIVPTTSFSTTGDAIDPTGGPKNPGPLNGDVQINGTVTFPLAKGLSVGYNRTSLGVLDAPLARQNLAGKPLYPGGSRDVVQSYVIDYHFSKFNVEGGFANRERSCCPSATVSGTAWNKGFLGVSYATPPIDFLNKGFFVFDITGNASHQNPSPETIAAFPVGLVPTGDRTIFTTQQAVTAVIPVDRKHGVRTAATFLWGALDYFRVQPFPFYYDVTVLSGTKQVNEYFGVTANVTNVIQRIQGAPFAEPAFAPGSGVRVSALNILADFHLDFNRILKRSEPVTTPGRPTTPGVPGGPGGPAQVGPTQGGTVSPAPSTAPSASP